MVRYATVMFYNRVLLVRWLDPGVAAWQIDPGVAPSAATCLEVQLAAAAVFIALGAWIFSTREFRAKTPEGN
jgi:ABC-2 type transport system permease protein